MHYDVMSYMPAPKPQATPPHPGGSSYLFEGCFSAMHRAICWQKVSGVEEGKMRVSSSLEHTALKHGSAPPARELSLWGGGRKVW